MQTQEIISRLNLYTGKHPTAALLAAIEKKEEMIPLLLECLDRTIADTQSLHDEHAFPLWSLYLLAQFRCQQAFPKMLDFLRMPESRLDNLIGDTLTEDFKNILASTFNGDLESLVNLVLDPSVFVWARDSALLSVSILVRHHLIPRDKAIQVFERFFERGFEAEDPSILIYGLVRACINIKAIEFSSHITACFEKGLITKEYDTLDNILHDLEHGERWPDTENLIDDVIMETDDWACFQERPVFDKESCVNEPFVRGHEKIGRNDPCPCESGKKYKKCCLSEAKAVA